MALDKGLKAEERVTLRCMRDAVSKVRLRQDEENRSSGSMLLSLPRHIEIENGIAFRLCEDAQQLGDTPQFNPSSACCTRYSLR